LRVPRLRAVAAIPVIDNYSMAAPTAAGFAIDGRGAGGASPAFLG